VSGAVPPPPAGPLGGWAKRALDLAIAVPAAVLLAPVMIAIAIWVRRDSPGGALFRQARVGYAGRPFALLKFRSMVVGAERLGAGLAITADDNRITRSGALLRRLSLDELPQVWNIIRGDMSLVGPRPTVAWQVAHYTPHQRRRLDARPGLTGLAQVSGRNALPWSERIELDIRYIDDWSLRADLAILARTVGVVLRRAGAYRDQGSAPRFALPLRERAPGPPVTGSGAGDRADRPDDTGA
jgi:lipopolysaccharide/colanic/teichoic acid biosynthesis glycosyltransferase